MALSAKPDKMHKSHVIPSASPHTQRGAGSGIGACFQLVLRHARKPRSLPALFWKNIIYAFAPRRRGPPEDPRVWNEIGRGLADRGRHEEALACYDRAACNQAGRSAPPEHPCQCVAKSRPFRRGGDKPARGVALEAPTFLELAGQQ